MENFENQINLLSIKRTKIKAIKQIENEDVYDLTVQDNHNFYANTLLVHNCGELPLCSGDSCRLLSLNLYSYVVNPFTKNAYFDFELFNKHAIIAQRLMDDIVDIELEKIDLLLEKIKSDPENEDIKKVEYDMWLEIKEKATLGRRTGTGITAEGDMLAALGLRYGTPNATEFSVNVHKNLALNVYKSSCILAKERGAFPIYDRDMEVNHPFITRLIDADSELKELMYKYGRRNIACLTIAPTGTVSIMTQTTSGIEPAFMVLYGRNRKVNPNDKNVKVAFVDQNGDSWESYVVFHNHFKTWLSVNGYNVEEVSKMSMSELNEIVKLSPYYMAMANDVDWLEKVKMQGYIQKWIDHSISVTVNLPEHVTEELVNDVYVTAWRYGCKGCTIYRDNCRTGVLVNIKEESKTENNDKEISFKENHAPKRPKYLNCEIHRFINKGEKWVGFVGLLDGRPYEIFTGKLTDLVSNTELPNDIEKGKIRKTKHENGIKTYDFIFEIDGKEYVIEALNRSFDPNTYDMSKVFSGILRHGMPLPYVVTMVDSLNLDGDLINTWKSGIKRMIKKYIPDGTEIKSPSRPANCPNKDNNEVKCNLVYMEGCLTCTTCGNSKCG